jgi:DNA-binding response OmpR family regulator
LPAKIEKMHVLIVEDNVDLCANMWDFLESRGHTVDAAHDGASGFDRAVEHDFDVMVLDLSLPIIDGVEVCRRLRAETKKAIPILILTARDSLEDKLLSFDSGADDYLVKPFALQELEARLLALKRRAQPDVDNNTLQVADLTMNLDTLTVQRDGHPIKLTPMDMRILELLMRQTRRVISRRELEKLLWQDEPPDSDALRAHIHTLRCAIDKPFAPALIRTIHGVGYRLAEPDGAEK